MKTRLEVLCKLNGQQGGTIHEFTRKYGVNILELSNKSFFKLLFKEVLTDNYQKNPSYYSFTVDELPKVVERMQNSIDDFRFNKDSYSFKKVCSLLGIKHTYKAIEEFFDSENNSYPEPTTYISHDNDWVTVIVDNKKVVTFHINYVRKVLNEKMA